MTALPIALALLLPAIAGACVVSSQCNAPFGSCINGVCKCDAGFLPPACTAFCQNRTGCSDHGNCVANNDIPKCDCDPGWPVDILRCIAQLQSSGF